MKSCQKYGKNYGTAADRAVYNGPFKVDDWKQEDKTLLSKISIIGIKRM